MADASSSLLFPLAENIALASLILLAYDQLRSRIGRYGLWQMQAVFGVMTGGVVILAMTHPINVGPGVFVDGRWTMIGLCGFFVGPVAGAVALALSVSYRMALGGAGLGTGVAGLLIAVIVGVGCRQVMIRTRTALTYATIAVPAVVLALVGTISVAFLPAELRWQALTVTGPAVMLTTGLGFWTFGVLMLNIRRRSEIEDELNESRRRFSAIVENLPGVVYQRIMTADGRMSYAYVSAGIEAMIGVAAADIAAGKYQLNDFIHPADKEAVLADIRATAAAPAPSAGHFRVVRADGTVRWVHGESHAHRQADGTVVWDGLLMDETDEVNSQIALRESKERYRLLSETAMDMVVRCNLDWARFYVSPSATQVLGYDSKTLLGLSPVELVHPEDLPSVRAAMDSLTPANPRATVVYRALHRDGHYVWLELAQRLILDSKGQPSEIMCAARDVTARVTAERDLAATAAKLEAARVEAEEAKEKAEAGSRAKSAFLAKMSHEIRTPMHGIMGMAHLLEQTALDARQRTYNSAIIDSANSLMSIVNDILDVSKLEAGRLELEAAEFDLPELVGQCLSLLGPTAADKGLRVVQELRPEVRRTYRGDPTRLRQILLNLVGNAVKFTEKGSVQVRVSETAVSAGHATLRVEVIDTGIGIEPAALPHLFHNFSQADDSITRRFGGSGLGLAISRQLVELMGGEIGVKSRPGEGSCFWCTVRLDTVTAGAASVPPGDEALPADMAAEATTTAPATVPRVLLAEDVMVNQLIATELLERMGCAVDLAQNGQEAVDAMRARDYDLVLMDVHMPVMDGLEAARAIRALDGRRAKVPIVALTADAIAGVREQYLAAGMDDFLSKPFTPHELHIMVERWTEGLAPGSLTAPPSPSAPAAAPIVDDKHLADIARIMPAEKFSFLLDNWLKSTADRLERIGSAAERADLPEVRREAHDLVSTAGNVGAAQLAAVARRLEEACAAGDATDVRSLVAEIRIAAPPTCDAVRRRLATAG